MCARFWFDNNKCAWPNKNLSNHKKAIENRIRPNSMEFDYYEARILSTDISKNINKCHYQLKIKIFVYFII